MMSKNTVAKKLHIGEQKLGSLTCEERGRGEGRRRRSERQREGRDRYSMRGRGLNKFERLAGQHKWKGDSVGNVGGRKEGARKQTISELLICKSCWSDEPAELNARKKPDIQSLQGSPPEIPAIPVEGAASVTDAASVSDSNGGLKRPKKKVSRM
eukprot:141326-Hanusia_phi.AAC.1